MGRQKEIEAGLWKEKKTGKRNENDIGPPIGDIKRERLFSLTIRISDGTFWEDKNRSRQGFGKKRKQERETRTT